MPFPFEPSEIRQIVHEEVHKIKINQACQDNDCR